MSRGKIIDDEAWLVFVAARPFLKWAGGKRQLLSEIEARLPPDIADCTTYIEPFVGGGAVLFHLLGNYDFEHVHISDLNPELILCYRSLQRDAEAVFSHLSALIEAYPDEHEQQSTMFYEVRSDWNSDVGQLDGMSEDAEALRTARTIFLNKTCFNGLFRVNSKGEFNVPVGSYARPSFPSLEALSEVQNALDGVVMHVGPFSECEKWLNGRTFVYFDPPYRPLSETSRFVSYSKRNFSDSDQKILAKLFVKLDKMGAAMLLSNSDPKNSDPADCFFDELYSRFIIDRVLSKRAINSDPDSRGVINEILVRNYKLVD